jgi:hypothetical protein
VAPDTNLPPAAWASIPMPLAEVLAIATEYERAGRLDDAERLVGHLLAEMPDHAEALHLGGIVAYRRKRPDEALLRMERAIELGGDMPLGWRNMSEIYRGAGRLEEAEAAARRAIALAPEDPICLHNLAVILYHKLDPAGSLEAAEAALAISPSLPGAHLAMAEALLLQGRMERGWDEYEWRFSIAGAAPPMPPTDKPKWDGAPVDGTLLVVADQGFGDAIQFMRYLPWVAERCPRLALATSPDIAPLLRQVAPDATIFTRWQDAPPFDARITLSGLPRLHRTRLQSIPWQGPYLRAEPERERRWAARLADLLPQGFTRVGVVWAGRPTHSNDRNRSMALPILQELAKAPGIALVGLQKGPSAADAGSWFGRGPFVGLGPELADFSDTQAVLAQLDLLVAVDTSVAHLAGAMGRPVWLMLPAAPDWRWLLGRADSPWYPAHRLFRQGADRQWGPVAAQVAAALRDTAPRRPA